MLAAGPCLGPCVPAMTSFPAFSGFLPAFALLLAALPAGAAPAATCYVRAEAGAEGAASFLGLRRKTDKLFDVDLSVSTAPDTSCSVGGVAKLQGEPGSEVLGLVVRPDPSRKSGRSGNLCQVFVRLTAEGVEIATTPTACQAQALCEGKVELDGQRFAHATRLAPGAPGPCFEKRPAP